MRGDGVVLVVGSGGRAYREYLLALAARQRPLWLLDGTPMSWQAKYAQGGTVVPLLDEERLVPDLDLLLKAAHEVHARHGVAGVFTYDESLVVATAHIAESLSLPGLTVDGADACRNKHRTRLALTSAGLPQPRFAYVLTQHDAARVAGEFGYPVVVKPRGAGASIGVMKAAGPQEMTEAFALAEAATHGGAPAYEGGVLVEEYLAGPEISVDGAVSHGDYQPFLIARKMVGYPPYFAEVGHTATAADPLYADEDLRRVLTRAHQAVGVRDGITHTEIRLTDRGPCVIEINARLGGDLIPYIGMLATGIDPGRIAVELAVGERPTLTAGDPPERDAPGRGTVEQGTVGRGTVERGVPVQKTVGIHFANPPRDGRVTGIRLPIPGDPPALLEAKALADIGTVVRLPPRAFLSRYAYLICQAETPIECADALADVLAHTSVDLDPVDPA